MLSTIALTPSRFAHTLCLALAVLSGPTAIAAQDPSTNMSAADYDAKMQDFDTQRRNILNAPVDFCNPVAMDDQMHALGKVETQEYELRRQRQKVHPTVSQDTKAAEATFADEGLLTESPQIVDEYEAALGRSEAKAANALMGKMTPWEREKVAEIQHDYALTFKILTPMADQGDVKAQSRLAVLYSWTTNFNMVALKAFRAKFDPGSPPDVPRDDALAFKYARLASLNGDEVAQEVLAKAYACGLGTQRDLVQAYAWFGLAISQSALMLNTDYEPEVLLRRRDFLAAGMPPGDIQRAKRLLIRCHKSEYKACD